MDTRKLFFLILMGSLSVLQSCNRSSDDVWEDTKSAGRHMKRGIRALAGQHGDSRQILSPNEFECIEDEEQFGYQQNGAFQGGYPSEDLYYPSDSYSISQDHDGEGIPLSNRDFIPLHDPTHTLIDPNIAPPPRETPGEAGSSIPGIEAFRDPGTHPQLASIFRPIYFAYDSSLVKGSDHLQTLQNIAQFLCSHPNVFVFIEGHTDERGPQAYNLALGLRRAHAVRNALIDRGVNPNHLFTISYGKERPVILEHHEEGWAKNRRDEFKVYER